MVISPTFIIIFSVRKGTCLESIKIWKMMLYYFRNLIKRRRRDLRDAKVKVDQSQELQYGTYKLFSPQICLFAVYFLWKLDRD